MNEFEEALRQAEISNSILSANPYPGMNTTAVNPLKPGMVHIERTAFQEKEPWLTDEIGHFRVRKIENGFIVEYARRHGERHSSIYAETPQALSDAIVAKLVASRLEER